MPTKKRKRTGGHLETLGFSSYLEYLDSPLWASIRARVFATKGRVCIQCRERKAQQVHHTEYGLETLAGRTIETLMPVCRTCHEALHGIGQGAVAPIVLRAPSVAGPPRGGKRGMKATLRTVGLRREYSASRAKRRREVAIYKLPAWSHPEYCHDCKELFKPFTLQSVTKGGPRICTACFDRRKQNAAEAKRYRSRPSRVVTLEEMRTKRDSLPSSPLKGRVQRRAAA